MNQGTGAARAVLPIVPGDVVRSDADPRTAAVATFRDLAARIESGQLHGARVQWRHGTTVIETVEMDATQVRYNAVACDAPQPTALDAKEVPFNVTKAQLLAEIDRLIGENEALRAQIEERGVS